MSKVVAQTEMADEVVLLLNDVLYAGLTDILGAQAYVYYLDAAGVLLTVGKQHGQLLLLNGQREVGTHDMGTDVESVVLAEQS